ncbi:MAG TPA: ATP-binding protein [Gemmataceae bacterium]|nr:ATP-binding protein [Gemmataceae bacterium]
MGDDYKRALEASESRFRTLIEKNADGILVVRGDGILDYVNPAAEGLLGRRADELNGEMFGQPLTAGETTEIDVWPAPRRAIPFAGMGPPYDRSPFRIAEMRVVEIDWNGQPAFLATLRDITERKEAVRRRDEFLAMLAHELRNPLAPILNAAHLMHLHRLPTAELEHARAIIERQGRHLTRLLDDLLDLSRVTHGKIELRRQHVNLQDIVADAVQSSRSLIEGRSHQLNLSLQEEQPLHVEADPTRLTQVVVNLLNNAAKYTEPGGRIELSLHGEQSQAILRVKDSGMGIPPDMLASIFEPFMQLKSSLDRAPGGLGIGLALVHRLVDLHGGTIAAHSDGAGHGSEFVVRLPLDSRLKPAMAPSTPQKVVPRRLLLIEDNADGRATLAALLRLLGHHVEEASDGLCGLAAIRRQAPEAALVDVGLPGMDGYELARQVRAAPDGDKVLLVAVTGYGQPEDRHRALEAGFNAHLVKPVDMDELARILAQLPP